MECRRVLLRSKNHSLLLDIMQAAKKAAKKDVLPTLLLVGDGDLRADIEAEAGKKGVREMVHFAGKRDDVATMLHSMDVFVFPSIFEGLRSEEHTSELQSRGHLVC